MGSRRHIHVSWGSPDDYICYTTEAYGHTDYIYPSAGNGNRRSSIFTPLLLNFFVESQS